MNEKEMLDAIETRYKNETDYDNGHPDKRMITGVLIKPDEGTAEKATIENSLDSLYAALDCDVINIAGRTICGHPYDIVCDENGLLRNDYYVSAVDEKKHPMLIGRLFVCHHDDEGELTSLTDHEIKHVLKQCRLAVRANTPNREYYRMLCHVGY